MSESSGQTAAKKPLLSDGAYATLKHSAAIVLPALSALYFALSQIWHFPHAEQVMATIAAFNTAVGALVGISAMSYNKSDAKYVGTLVRSETDDRILYSLQLNDDAPALDHLTEANFKVADQ
jgi:hypothetical protein